MEEAHGLSLPVRFGIFEVDLQAGELRRKGYKVKLQDQPFQILIMLLARPGQVVTREELQNKLWPADTFVDFDRGLNRAINKLRGALEDNADNPRFIETLPRRGYRFLAPLEMHAHQRAAGKAKPLVLVHTDTGHTRERSVSPRPGASRPFLLWAGVSSITVTIAALATVWLFWHGTRQSPADLVERRLTFNSTARPIASAAISPDGKYLAYSDPTGIYVRLLSTGEERAIPTPDPATPNTFSYVDSWFPNGTELLVHLREAGGHARMWAVSIMGSAWRELRDGAAGWEVAPDGTRIAFSPTGPDFGREIWAMDSDGRNPRKVLRAGADELLWSVHWSAGGHRLAYVRGYPGGRLIETCDLNGANRTHVVVGDVRSICWLSDKRIVYSQGEGHDIDANLWQIGVDTGTGAPVGKPKRITDWAGSDIPGISASADGTRVVLRKQTYPSQVYIGELGAGRTPIRPATRLTYDDAHDWATAWTADSKAVLFTSNVGGKWGIFKQGISDPRAEPITQGREKADLARLSADGAWILYVESSGTPDGQAGRQRVMRVPVNGGSPTLVFDIADKWQDHQCATSPATLCIIIEATRDDKRLIISAFDPIKGKGKLLRTMDKAITDGFGYSLSPDGSTLAIARGDEPEIHIRLLSTTAGNDREIAVKGWPNLNSLEWSPDGKGLYCGSLSSQGTTLLLVHLNGTAQVLWHSKELDGAPFIAGVPSPNGRYLALTDAIRNTTAWMLEGF